MAIERQRWNPRNRLSNKSRPCQTIQHSPNKAWRGNERVCWDTRAAEPHTELIMSTLKAQQPKQGEGERSSKETNQENKPWHWLSHRKVSEMLAEENPIRVLVSWAFQLPGGEASRHGEVSDGGLTCCWWTGFSSCPLLQPSGQLSL